MRETVVISHLLVMGFISLLIDSVVVLVIAALSSWTGILNAIAIIFSSTNPYVSILAIFYSILFLFNTVYMVLNVVGSSLSSLYDEHCLRKVGVTFLIVINSILAIFFVANLIVVILAFVFPNREVPLLDVTGGLGVVIGVCQYCLFVYGIIHIVVSCKNRDIVVVAVGDSTVISNLFILAIVSEILNSVFLILIATASCILGVYYAMVSLSLSPMPSHAKSAGFHWIQFLSSIAFLVTNTIAFTLGYQYRDRYRKIGVILLIVTNSILSVFFVINLILAVIGSVFSGITVAFIVIFAGVIGVCQIVLFVYNTIHTVVIFKSLKLGNRQAEEIQRNELTEI